MKCAGGNKVEEKGQWIGEGLRPGWKCSICGEHIVLDVFRWGKFCPNCGTKTGFHQNNQVNRVYHFEYSQLNEKKYNYEQ